ncbi:MULTISPECIES: hypothetical protein [unclassified Nocardioides]|uniref:hypothetical protein n=1 Tax=unclassified Nocardioides TaxID=2615069 RepID=UPI0030149074
MHTLGNTRTVRLAVVGLPVSALTLGAGGLAPSAVADGGGHHGDRDASVSIELTDRTTDRLTAGSYRIRALGAADKDVDDGDVTLSFPLRDRRKDQDRSRARHGGDGHRTVVRVAGGIGVIGDGADARWTGLRVNLKKGTLSAKVNGGDRATVLHTERDRGLDRRGGSRSSDLELTRAGARSLNDALPGNPFRAGDTFADESEGCGR